MGRVPINTGRFAIYYTLAWKYELYPTIHHSSRQHAIHGLSCVLLPLPNLTTYLLLNLKSIYLMLPPFPLIFLVLPLSRICLGHHGLSQHRSRKKRKETESWTSCAYPLICSKINILVHLMNSQYLKIRRLSVSRGDACSQEIHGGYRGKATVWCEAENHSMAIAATCIMCRST